MLMESKKENQTTEMPISPVSLPQQNISAYFAETTPVPAGEISKKKLSRHKRTGRSTHGKL